MKLKHIFSLIIFNLFFGLILATNYGVFSSTILKLNDTHTSETNILILTGEISVDSEEACLNQTPGPSITFTGSDSDDNFPYTFEYTINDGVVNTISTSDSSPSVSIEAPTSEVGEFTYTLISITDSSNEIVALDSEIIITINSLPEVSFVVESGDGACSGTPVVFNSTVSGDAPFSYAWDFGDGAISDDPNPTHTYTETGCGTTSYSVVLTVTDGNGCTADVTETVDILEEPDLDFFDLINFPYFRSCAGGNFEISVGNQSPSSSCISSYNVDWGDGSSIQTNITFPINHQYTSLGVFDLTFTGFGINGCNSSKKIEVVNSTNPIGGLSSPGNTTNLCAPSSPLNFVISNWHENPLDTSYFINYGDGSQPVTIEQSFLVDSEYFDPPQDYPIPHIYTETNCPSGPFTVILDITTACGATNLTAGPISLVKTPDISFISPEIECINTPILFNNTSENGFGENCNEEALWRWNFGDGTVVNIIASSPPDGTHTYLTPGIYNVSLVAVNSAWNNCLPEPFIRQICIEAPLIPLFSVTETEGCGPLIVITNNTTDESTSCEEVDYLWTVTYDPGYCGNTSIYSFINGTDETSTNPELLFEGPGIYSLTLSATNSCGTESTVQNINVKSPPTITLDPIDDVCAPAEITPMYDFDICEANTLEFNWIIIDGTSPTDWEFTGGSNASSPNPTINFITPNTYIITVELTNECGTASSSQTFSVLPIPEITNTDLIQTICSGIQVDEIVFESTEPGTTFSWITTATTNINGEELSDSGDIIPAHVLTLTDNNPGSVTYSVTPSLGDCEGTTIDFVINVVPAPTFTLQPVGDAVCIDGTTPPLSVAYINGTGTPTYEWYRVGNPDELVGTEATFQPPTDQAGVFSYYVVISFPEDGGCSDITSDTVDITVYQAPILSDFTTTICSGETFSIDPDETNGDIVPVGTTYTWSDPVIFPLGAILGASGETTPQNSISQTLSNPDSGVIATATYTVIPNSEICPGDPFTIVVTVNPQINVAPIVTNSACFGFDNAQIEITITGGVPFTTGDPYDILWNGPGPNFPSTDEDIFNLEPGTYTLEIVDSEGCEFTDTYIITQPEELLLGSLDVFEDITCFGFDDGQIAVTIIGGTLDYIYEWEKDGDGAIYSNDEDLTNLPPGLYVLTVTDENGCILELDPLEIIEPELLTITLIEKVDIDCYGFNTGSIDIEANGGRPDYTYSWTGPAGFTSSDPDIFDLFPGTYTLVVTDTSGCTETLTEVIVQNDEITATINVTDVTCYGYNNGIIEIESIVGGVPFTTGDPYDILWSNLGSGLLQENLSPGIYTITITDALGCIRQYEIEVLEAPIFTLDPDVDQISCSGEDDGRIAINIVGGVAPLTVFWLDDPSAGIVRNNLPPGIYNVTVTDSSPIGPCVIEQEFVILPVAPLEISATVIDAFDCDDPNSGSINLSITGGTVSSSSSYSITWSNGATTEDLINIGPGVYFVTVVDDNNCQITGQWEVNRFDPLDVNVTTETIADCNIGELYQVFTASTTGGIPDYTYLWSSGEVSGINGEIMTATQNGTVTLTVTDSIGCIDNYSFNVDLPEIGEVNFDQTSVGFINFGFYSILEPIQFINLTGGDYQVIIWDFGDGNFSNQENPTHTYTTPGTYTVTLTVTYPFGCTYAYSYDIIIEKGYKLIFPNAFTPNQDNLNDYFRPEYAGLNNLELRIFDTWGSQIYFESGNNISGWNGILKNKLAENGNYYYTFKAKTSYGEVIIQDGPFTLIR